MRHNVSPQQRQAPSEQVAKAKPKAPKIDRKQLQHSLREIKQQWTRPEPTASTKQDSLSKAEQAAQAAIDKRLHRIHVPRAFARDNPPERAEKMRIAKSSIQQIKIDIREFYKAQEQKQLTRGGEAAFRGFGKGTAKHLDRMLGQRFDAIAKGNTKKAQGLRDGYEQAGRAAYTIAGRQMQTKGSETIIGKDKARLNALASRACEQIQNDQVNDAQKTIRQYDRRATTAFQGAEQRMRRGDSTQKTAQARDTSRSTQRDQTVDTQSTERTRRTQRPARRQDANVRAQRDENAPATRRQATQRPEATRAAPRAQRTDTQSAAQRARAAERTQAPVDQQRTQEPTTATRHAQRRRVRRERARQIAQRLGRARDVERDTHGRIMRRTQREIDRAGQAVAPTLGRAAERGPVGTARDAAAAVTRTARRARGVEGDTHRAIQRRTQQEIDRAGQAVAPTIRQAERTRDRLTDTIDRVREQAGAVQTRATRRGRRGLVRILISMQRAGRAVRRRAQELK
jgi:hypothetical protein